MKAMVLSAGLALALAMTAGALAAPAPASPPRAGGVCKVVCAPAPAPAKAGAKPAAKPVAAKPAMVKQASARRTVRHRSRHFARHHSRHDYYTYRQADVARQEWHDAWHQAPNDAVIGGAQAYGPPPPPPPAYGAQGSYYEQGYAQDYRSYQGNAGACDCAYDQRGLQIDRYGWTGGVGNARGGEIFVDGYGMVHYGSSRSLNGPTYNSYGQSFPFNPSRAAPFQPRAMGGFARGGGPHR